MTAATQTETHTPNWHAWDRDPIRAIMAAGVTRDCIPSREPVRYRVTPKREGREDILLEMEGMTDYHESAVEAVAEANDRQSRESDPAIYYQVSQYQFGSAKGYVHAIYRTEKK